MLYQVSSTRQAKLQVTHPTTAATIRNKAKKSHQYGVHSLESKKAENARMKTGITELNYLFRELNLKIGHKKDAEGVTVYLARKDEEEDAEVKTIDEKRPEQREGENWTVFDEGKKERLQATEGGMKQVLEMTNGFNGYVPVKGKSTRKDRKF